MTDQAQPFSFDRHFEADMPESAVAPLVRRKLTPEEVEAERQAAFAEGQASAEAEAQRRLAAAAESLAASAQAIAGAMQQERSALEADAAALAVLTGTRLASGALARWPEEEIARFARACLAHLRSEPRLVLQASPDLQAALAPLVETVGDRLVLEADPAFTGADAALQWATGSARLDHAAADDHVGRELEAFLAGTGTGVHG